MKSGSRFRSRWSRLVPALMALGILAGSTGCSTHGDGKPKPSVPPGGILLQGAGATFPAPLYREWFDDYQKAHPQVVLTYEGVGSGEGIRRFIGHNIRDENKVDFGASDAAMQDNDIAQVPEGVAMVPMTAGGIVLAYNLPDVSQTIKLSRRAYAGIFLGEVTSWNDPLIAASNPGVKLPKLTIVTVVRQDASGTTYAFSKHLDAISDKWHTHYGPSTMIDWPGNAMRAKGNEGVAGILSHSVGGLGYVGYEFAHRYGLQIARLENKSGNFVAPNEDSLRAALASAELPENLRAFVPDPAAPDAYPMATFTWILLRRKYEDSSKAQALRELFSWTLGEGQHYASALGYIPLPSEIGGKALTALQRIKP